MIAFTISKFPNKWFGKDNKLYHVTKKHQKVYEFFGIRKWKDKAWELGGLGGFSKSKVLNPSEPEYIERFLNIPENSEDLKNKSTELEEKEIIDIKEI